MPQITTLQDLFDEASALNATVALTFRPRAPAIARYLVLIEPFDLFPSSANAATWEEAAATALAFYEGIARPTPPEET